MVAANQYQKAKDPGDKSVVIFPNKSYIEKT